MRARLTPPTGGGNRCDSGSWASLASRVRPSFKRDDDVSRFGLVRLQAIRIGLAPVGKIYNFGPRSSRPGGAGGLHDAESVAVEEKYAPRICCSAEEPRGGCRESPHLAIGSRFVRPYSQALGRYPAPGTPANRQVSRGKGSSAALLARVRLQTHFATCLFASHRCPIAGASGGAWAWAVIRRSQTAIGNCNWNLVLPVP